MTEKREKEWKMRTSGKDFIGLKKLFRTIKQDGVSRDTFFQTAAEVYDESTHKAIVAEDSLLELLGTVVVPKATKFVARNYFVVNTKAFAPIKISYLGDNFREWFLDKIEAPSNETTLRYHTMRRASVDGPIIAELGGENKVKTSLFQIYALMKAQGDGRAGVLLNSGYANIFYVHGRAVLVIWDGDGWGVDACLLDGPYGWDDGYRVFSRNS